MSLDTQRTCSYVIERRIEAQQESSAPVLLYLQFPRRTGSISGGSSSAQGR
jgi:hypothetical protein